MSQAADIKNRLGRFVERHPDLKEEIAELLRGIFRDLEWGEADDEVKERAISGGGNEHI